MSKRHYLAIGSKPLVTNAAQYGRKWGVRYSYSPHQRQSVTRQQASTYDLDLASLNSLKVCTTSTVASLSTPRARDEKAFLPLLCLSTTVCPWREVKPLEGMQCLLRMCREFGARYRAISNLKQVEGETCLWCVICADVPKILPPASQSMTEATVNRRVKSCWGTPRINIFNS